MVDNVLKDSIYGSMSFSFSKFEVTLNLLLADNNFSDELIHLKELWNLICPVESTTVEIVGEDDEDQEYLENVECHPDIDNVTSFPEKCVASVFNWNPLTLNQFTLYIFVRKFGWSDLNRTESSPTLSSEEYAIQIEINNLLTEFISWYREQQLSKILLKSLHFCVNRCHDKPFARNHTTIHSLTWISHRLTIEQIDDTLFDNIRTSLLLALCDVWSAIRNGCVNRLGFIVDQFTFEYLEQFFVSLLQICRDNDSSWQAKEGALMAIHCIIRRFQWIEYIPPRVTTPRDRLGSGVESKPTMHAFSDSPDASPRTTYSLRFGKYEFESFPEYIELNLKSTIYPLLAHCQNSIRENATKALASYLARCDFENALSTFKDVIDHLCKGITNHENPVLSVYDKEFQFLNAFAASGLLGVCVFLVKHIPPGFLLPNWPVYFSTFSLYLSHPASIVRQSTSTIFKFLVHNYHETTKSHIYKSHDNYSHSFAKDSGNPTFLRLILHDLSSNWNIKADHLKLITPDYSKELLSMEPFKKSNVLPGARDSWRKAARLGSYIEYVSHTPSSNKEKSISSLSQSTTELSECWEWQEGRLLAYELILRFLIKNHMLYTFGMNAPPSVPMLTKAVTLPTPATQIVTTSSGTISPVTSEDRKPGFLSSRSMEQESKRTLTPEDIGNHMLNSSLPFIPSTRPQSSESFSSIHRKNRLTAKDSISEEEPPKSNAEEVEENESADKISEV